MIGVIVISLQLAVCLGAGSSWHAPIGLVSLCKSASQAYQQHGHSIPGSKEGRGEGRKAGRAGAREGKWEGLQAGGWGSMSVTWKWSPGKLLGVEGGSSSAS